MLKYGKLKSIQSAIGRLRREDEGASLVEYVLLLALIAVACIGAMNVLSNSAPNSLLSSANKIP